MRNQLKQVLFLAIFGILCTAFVIFVPWGVNPEKSETATPPNQTDWMGNPDFSSEQNTRLLTGTLTLAIPEKKINPELKQFLQNFSQKYEVNITLTRVMDEGNRLKLTSWADIQLLPYDLFSGVQAQKITFQEDIRSLFIPQLQGFLGKYSDFLPFALDPAVMYGLTGLESDFDGLYVSFSDFRPRLQNASFGFWIRNIPALYDQNLILAQQLEDFVQFNDVGAFQQWIAMHGNTQALQQKLLNIIQSSSQFCLQEPIACLLQKKLVGVGRGFASDFSSDLKEEFVRHFSPYQYVGLPVRLYGFVVLPGANRALTDQFLLDYMDSAFQSSVPFLGSGMIPVFQNQFTQTCGADACSLPQELVILENGPAKIEKFFNDRLLWKIIEKKLQPDLYLKNASL